MEGGLSRRHQLCFPAQNNFLVLGNNDLCTIDDEANLMPISHMLDHVTQNHFKSNFMGVCGGESHTLKVELLAAVSWSWELDKLCKS